MDKRIELISAKCLPDLAKVSWVPVNQMAQDFNVKMKLVPKLPHDEIRFYVKFIGKTTKGEQTTVILPVTGYGRGAFSAVPEFLALGEKPVGTKVEQRLLVKSTNGDPYRMQQLTSNLPDFSWKTSSKSATRLNRLTMHFTISTTGDVATEIRIELQSRNGKQHRQFIIPVAYRGVE